MESWQIAPQIILTESIIQYNKLTEEANFLSFLLLDVSMEMVLRTFLALPRRLTGVSIPEDIKKKESESGFYDLINGVAKARKNLAHDLSRVQYFHGIRNKLYHEGNGISVPRSHLEEYMKLAEAIAFNLLKIDLKNIRKSITEPSDKILLLESLKKEAEQFKTKIQNKLRELYTEIELIIEVISPSLLLPSFKNEFKVFFELALRDEVFDVDEQGDVVKYKSLPKNKSERVELSEGLSKIIKPRVSDSKYYNKLFSKIVVSDVERIAEDLLNYYGVENYNIQLPEIDSLTSIVFYNHFDLEVLYTRIVEIALDFEDKIQFKIDWWNMYPAVPPDIDIAIEIKNWKIAINDGPKYLVEIDEEIECLKKWKQTETKYLGPESDRSPQNQT